MLQLEHTVGVFFVGGSPLLPFPPICVIFNHCYLLLLVGAFTCCAVVVVVVLVLL